MVAAASFSAGPLCWLAGVRRIEQKIDGAGTIGQALDAENDAIRNTILVFKVRTAVERYGGMGLNALKPRADREL